MTNTTKRKSTTFYDDEYADPDDFMVDSLPIESEPEEENSSDSDFVSTSSKKKRASTGGGRNGKLSSKKTKGSSKANATNKRQKKQHSASAKAKAAGEESEASTTPASGTDNSGNGASPLTDLSSNALRKRTKAPVDGSVNDASKSGSDGWVSTTSQKKDQQQFSRMAALAATAAFSGLNVVSDDITTTKSVEEDTTESMVSAREETPSSSNPAEDGAAMSPKEEEPALEPTDDEFFQHFRLKRILKENHGRDISQCGFALSNVGVPKEEQRASSFDGADDCEVDTSNVLATVGGNQANIYDNQHCGDHLDIMSHFVLEEPDTSGQSESPDLQSLCWIRVPSDALLAVAGGGKSIHVLSLANSREITRLEGHQGRIVDIQSHPSDPNLLLSIAQDGTARLWHFGLKKCICSYSVRATSAAFHPSGLSFVTGAHNGDIQRWEISQDILLLSEAEAEKVPLEHIDEAISTIPSKKINNGAAIDCIKFVGEDKLLSKSVNGKVVYWNLETLEDIHVIQIKGGLSNACRFDVSSNNQYFCVGNGNGAIFVYNLETGKCVSELRHRRSTKAVRCVVFARDMRNIIYVGEDSIVWRYDFVVPRKDH
ncbi:hypothetical protein HK102_001613 [Quaeritorhiza haematococci]|nr:hypothetical protein HK102_001613 [Quaeritorhiza haematococci]